MKKKEVKKLFNDYKYEEVVSILNDEVALSSDDELLILFSLSSELMNLPHLKQFIDISRLIKYPLLDKVIQILQVPSSPLFDFGKANTLIYFRVGKSVDRELSLDQGEFVFEYEDVIPFKVRKPQQVKDPSIKPLEREYRQMIDRVVRGSELQSKAERGGVHLAIKKIHFMMVALNYFILEKVSPERNKSITETAEDIIDIEYQMVSKQMKLYRLIADLLNWRIMLDARVFEGCENIKIEYNENDVKMACQRIDKPVKYLNSIS